MTKRTMTTNSTHHNGRRDRSVASTCFRKRTVVCFYYVLPVLLLCSDLQLQQRMGVVATGLSSTSRGRGFGRASSRSGGSSSNQLKNMKVKKPQNRKQPAVESTGGVDKKKEQQHPLLVWLDSSTTETQPDLLELRASQCGDGIGAFLTKPVNAGDIVLAVPSTAFLSVGNALQRGPGFRQLWENTSEDDPKGTTVLAAYVAHLLLGLQKKKKNENNKNRATSIKNDSSSQEKVADCSDEQQYGEICGSHDVYLNMLPQQGPGEKHALWWTDAEVELIRDTGSAYEEWIEMRADVDEMIATIMDSGILLEDVSQYGNAKVTEALRAGFVAVLSRAYGVFSSSNATTTDAAVGRQEFKALVPLLDALNHATVPNVQYAYEGLATDEAGLSGLLVGRALGPLQKGDELTITYGSHPDYIFGLYFGFIPESGIPQDPDTVQKAKRMMKDRLAIRSEGAGVVPRQCCQEMAFSMILSDMTHS